MKKTTFLLLASLIVLAACNNKSKQNTAATNNGTSSTNTTTSSETSTPANDMAKAIEELKGMPALSTDQLKALLPETLLGMKRTGFSANSMAGYGLASGKYKSDDGKELNLIIYDCVGPAGVAFYNMMYLGMNMEQEDENGYRKTTTFSGIKAIESYDKSEQKYTLTFPSNNRLLVTVEGENTGLDAVKQAAGSLNLKVN
jgi:hypothetical protein